MIPVMRSSVIGHGRRWRCLSASEIALKHVAAIAILFGMLACALNAEAVSPRRLVEVVDIGRPVVSPDGSWVAFRTEQAVIERNTYDTVWYVRRMDGASPPLRVADGGTPLRNSAGASLPAVAIWSPDGRWIYYRAMLEGRIDVWRAAADGSGVERVTQDAADVRDFSISADGQLLQYLVGASRENIIAAELDEYYGGIRIDGKVPIGQGLFRSTKIEGRLATQRYSGNWFDRDFLLADVPGHWKAVDLATRITQELAVEDFPPVPIAAADLADVSDRPWRLAHDPATGRIALLRRMGAGEGLALKPEVQLSMLPSPRARHPVPCLAELCVHRAISSLQWRPGGNDVLFTVTDPDAGQAQAIFRWDVGTGDVYPVLRSTGLVSGGRDAYSECGISKIALACVASEANAPPRLERIDLASGERRILFAPNEALARDQFGAVDVQLFSWKDPESRHFTGQLILAKARAHEAPPLFVTYYSCPGFLRGGVGDEWPLATLAARGIAVLCINQYREFPLDAIERYNIALSAVASAIDLLAFRGQIDRSRVGMGGLSFGSEVTLWTAVHSDLLAAASVSSPVLSPTYYMMGSLKGQDFVSELQRVWQVDASGEPSERWKELSPAFNLDKFRSPLLMQMPEQEYLYAIDYAIPLILDQRADLYVFPHEAHQKFQPKHKLAVYQRNLDWFLFWLKGVEDADPAKENQYSHWRSMKARARQSSAPNNVQSND